jgi:hypothetical protein
MFHIDTERLDGQPLDLAGGLSVVPVCRPPDVLSATILLGFQSRPSRPLRRTGTSGHTARTESIDGLKVLFAAAKKHRLRSPP